MPAPQTPRIPLVFQLGSAPPQPVQVGIQLPDGDPFPLDEAVQLHATWRAGDGGPNVVSGEFLVLLDHPSTDLGVGFVVIGFDTDDNPAGTVDFPTYGDWKLIAEYDNAEPVVLVHGPFEQSRFLMDVAVSDDDTTAFFGVRQGVRNPLNVTSAGFGAGGSGSLSLEDLTDVTGVAEDGDVLTFNDGDNEWHPTTPSGGGDFTWPTYVSDQEPDTPSIGDTWLRLHNGYPDSYGAGLFYFHGEEGWVMVAPVTMTPGGANPLGLVTVGADGNVVIERFDGVGNMMSTMGFFGSEIDSAVSDVENPDRFMGTALDTAGLWLAGSSFHNWHPLFTWVGVWNPEVSYNVGSVVGIFVEDEWVVYAARTGHGGSETDTPFGGHPGWQRLNADDLPIILRGQLPNGHPNDTPTNDSWNVNTDSSVNFTLSFLLDDGESFETSGLDGVESLQADIQGVVDAAIGGGNATVTGDAPGFNIEFTGGWAGVHVQVGITAGGAPATNRIQDAIATQIAAPLGTLLVAQCETFTDGHLFVKTGTGLLDWTQLPADGADSSITYASGAFATEWVVQGEGSIVLSEGSSYVAIVDRDGAGAYSVDLVGEIDFDSGTAGEDGQPIEIDIVSLLIDAVGDDSLFMPYQFDGPILGLSGFINGTDYVGMLRSLTDPVWQVCSMLGALVTDPLEQNDQLWFRCTIIAHAD